MQIYSNNRTMRTKFSLNLISPAKNMVKIHPDKAFPVDFSVGEGKTSPYLTTEKESFTIWMRSLVFHSKGCTVFDSKGNLIYRVDNYNSKSCSEVYLMDLYGKILFTLRQKKLGLFKSWKGYNSTGTRFQLRKNFKILPKGSSSSYKVVMGSRIVDGDHQSCYKIVKRKSVFTIEDGSGRLLAEVKKKQSNIKSLDLGKDVLTMMVEPQLETEIFEEFIKMWRESASFILDKHQNNKPISLTHSIDSPPPPSASMADENPNPNPISAYYQTRAAHHGIVTSEWLEQAQAAVRRYPDRDSLVSGRPFSVIEDFNSWRQQPDLAEAVAAIRALAAVIRASEATTMMELEIELKKASDTLKSWDTTSISLTAGCDLFMRYVTRTSALEFEDFNSAKSRVLERAEKFGEISCKARTIIAMLSQDFIFDGCTILVHGFSRVVFEILKTSAQNKKLFRVLCTEGRPDKTGVLLANELAKLDIPVKLLIDSAVAYSMDEVDMVFVGADGVVESGGIINMMGTYQIALVAQSMNKPVYVAAESYKFARLYPLDQKDLEPALRPIDFSVPVPPKVEVERSARDYTPPQYLTLLFTDLGVLTPSVVSDELIQLYL
ncbi:Eukaryotic translation initiation factor 2B (eIF-2B) family protein [Arabidopsis thaliana]|uniref:Translation initiation factor eIF2B subunit alpha n=7 Tax=Arabidopsis thaliana TaxID=3702 RepID=A0A1P8AT59_ARATH|nr:Eukaryotic translation initiation factor 2B (eIF-2B) family protein [Arabidopsis thaliana]ANM59844.1 Eukaryotic translation initiation factor 2B (eIF-2B) family protein [Arabidopsis thaliana]|eukprot:NP_001322173.1 Eukaryotic translation initiation factor 2B (eIF-2B) family protein [Arabidopsis thaliana]